MNDDWSDLMLCFNLSWPFFPPINNIGAMVIFWRQEERLSELFCVVLCTEAVHSHKHT